MAKKQGKPTKKGSSQKDTRVKKSTSPARTVAKRPAKSAGSKPKSATKPSRPAASASKAAPAKSKAAVRSPEQAKPQAAAKGKAVTPKSAPPKASPPAPRPVPKLPPPRKEDLARELAAERIAQTRFAAPTGPITETVFKLTKLPSDESGPSEIRIPKDARRRMSHLDDPTLAKIVAKLDELRRESLGVVHQHVAADLEQQKAVGDVGDDLDQAVTERNREFDLIMHQRHLRRLQQIQDAFGRLQDGSYGFCEGTEEPINPKRLLIMPLARFSLEYQEQQEKMLGRSPDDALGTGEESFAAEE
jgi:DnaK suppressor protein